MKNRQEFERDYILIEISFNPAQGYPAGDDLYYECLKCGELIPSFPQDNISCKCANISIDKDYGRMTIWDHALARAWNLQLKK